MPFSSELNNKINTRQFWASRSSQDEDGNWNFENIKMSEVREGDNVLFDAEGTATDADYDSVVQMLAQRNLHLTYPKDVKDGKKQFLVLPILEGTSA